MASVLSLFGNGVFADETKDEKKLLVVESSDESLSQESDNAATSEVSASLEELPAVDVLENEIDSDGSSFPASNDDAMSTNSFMPENTTSIPETSSSDVVNTQGVIDNKPILNKQSLDLLHKQKAHRGFIILNFFISFNLPFDSIEKTNDFESLIHLSILLIFLFNS